MGRAINLQDMFLNQVRKEEIPVTVYLNGNVQLRGVVRGFDAFSILLECAEKPTQLIYKHAVLSIVPSKAIPGYKPAPREEKGAEGAAE